MNDCKKLNNALGCIGLANDLPLPASGFQQMFDTFNVLSFYICLVATVPSSREHITLKWPDH